MRCYHSNNTQQKTNNLRPRGRFQIVAVNIPLNQLGHLIIEPLPEDERAIYDPHRRV